MGKRECVFPFAGNYFILCIMNSEMCNRRGLVSTAEHSYIPGAVQVSETAELS